MLCRLKLEELVSKLTESCSIPKVGFGRGEQFAEKNKSYSSQDADIK